MFNDFPFTSEVPQQLFLSKIETQLPPPRPFFVTPLLILGETEGERGPRIERKKFPTGDNSQKNMRVELKARTARRDMLGDRNETGYGG